MGGKGGGGGGSVSVNGNNRDARTDAGWTASSTIAQAAMIAITATQMAAAKEMNDRQISIMDRYVVMSERARAYWENIFQPRETSLLADTFSKADYVPDYERAAGRYTTAVKAAFGLQWDKLNCIPRYCAGLSPAMAKEIVIAQSIAEADARNFAYRVEEDRKDKKDDVLFSRKLAALALGRDLNQQAITAAAAASDIAGNLGAQASASASGAFGSLIYSLNRNPTPIPRNNFSPQNYQGLPNYSNYTNQITSMGNGGSRISDEWLKAGTVGLGSSFYDYANSSQSAAQGGSGGGL